MESIDPLDFMAEILKSGGDTVLTVALGSDKSDKTDDDLGVVKVGDDDLAVVVKVAVPALTLQSHTDASVFYRLPVGFGL